MPAPLSGLFGASGKSGSYRFIPHLDRQIAAGDRLFMLKVRGRTKVDLGESYTNGTTFAVEWVPIAKADNPDPAVPEDFVWKQGRAVGGARF